MVAYPKFPSSTGKRQNFEQEYWPNQLFVIFLSGEHHLARPRKYHQPLQVQGAGA